jgi:putative ABC transport system ATP-binding protein
MEATPPAYVLSMSHLAKRYVMGQEVIDALKDISLNISKNEYIALMGPSGSGKSTLMNILGCLDTPSSGTYWLNGLEVSTMRDAELATIRNKEIGFVFQTFNLLPRSTALENVALPLVYSGVGKRERNERASLVLESVGLANRMDHRPNELSGGQRQRVAIARALVNNPSIILADEPTGNLDTVTAAHTLALLIDLCRARQTSLVMVTHSDEAARAMGRTLRLTPQGLVC